jgi:DNA-binding LacI/PurR family transcriptional regulator
MYSGTFKPMNRNDIAKLAGVSNATISRFFTHPHLLSLEVRLKIEAIVLDNNYTPNTFAAQLAKKSKGKIALVYNPNNSLFEYQRFQAIYYLLLAELNKWPISLVIYTDSLDSLTINAFDKIIVMGSQENAIHPSPNILNLYPINEPKGGINYITVVAKEVGKNLAELFCPASKQMPLVLLPSGYQHSYLNEVILSFNETLKKHGVFPNPHHFLENADSFESGQASTAEGFNLGLDFHSIIAFNQEAALGAIAALKAEGMTYPYDAQVVHYGHPKEFYYAEHDITCLSDPLHLLIENIIKFCNGKTIQAQLSPILLKGQTY